MRRLVTVLVVAVVLAGCMTAVDEQTEEARFVGFSSGGGTCVNSTDVGIAVRTGEGFVRIRGNVTAPDANHSAVYDFERVSETNYSLRVATEADRRKPSRRCTAVVNYEASVELPEDSNVTVSVYHNGELRSRVVEYGDSVRVVADE